MPKTGKTAEFFEEICIFYSVMPKRKNVDCLTPTPKKVVRTKRGKKAIEPGMGENHIDL